jgi:hypothetical protein
MKYDDAKALILTVASEEHNGDCAVSRMYKAPRIKEALKKSALEEALKRMEAEGILSPSGPGKPRRVLPEYMPAQVEPAPQEESTPVEPAPQEEAPPPMLRMLPPPTIPPVSVPPPVPSVEPEEITLYLLRSGGFVFGRGHSGRDYLLAWLEEEHAAAYAQQNNFAPVDIECRTAAAIHEQIKRWKIGVKVMDVPRREEPQKVYILQELKEDGRDTYTTIKYGREGIAAWTTPGGAARLAKLRGMTDFTTEPKYWQDVQHAASRAGLDVFLFADPTEQNRVANLASRGVA